MEWVVIHHSLSLEEARVREQSEILEARSNFPEFGYNTTPGGQTGPYKRSRDQGHTEAIRQAQANPVLRSDGRPFLSSRQAAQEMGAGNEDAVSRSLRRKTKCGGFWFKRVSQEEYEAAKSLWVLRVSEGHVEQQPVWTKSRKGYRHTEEARHRMSSATRPHSPAHIRSRLAAIRKRVLRSDGVEFDSILAAAEAMGLSSAQISYSIKKGTPRGGLTFTLSSR